MTFAYQELGGSMKWWVSNARVLGCMYGGICCCMFTWVTCYFVWLWHGCRPWMPFVSDFGGGPTMYLFGAGMTLGALLLVPTWLDYHRTTKPHVCTAHWTWRCLHTVQPVVGIWCSLSIMGVALNPWNLRFLLHILSADGIFFGGLTFVLIGCVLECRRTRCHSLIAVAVLLVSGAALMLMFYFLGVGVRELKGTDASRDIGLQLMTHDFPAYCRGDWGPSGLERDVSV
eukprot:TRINITY_DN32335_c0_g1_i4.p1 TRINITY_DN32335_c0_g1~~TRINITY_DN32335_c0_g1_i4.p1  ORF type:complete len:250 (+),score=6.39 TRINITY_DN32335_c0_g1_i4:66-752(+)